MEGAADGAVLVRLLIGGADLPDDLLFAEDHGIQARRHRQHVLGGALGVADVEVGRQFVDVETGAVDYFADHRRQPGVETAGGDVVLDAVAGGDQHRLGNRVLGEEAGEGLGLVRIGHGHALQHGHWGGPVRHPDEQHTHGITTAIRSSSIRRPNRRPDLDFRGVPTALAVATRIWIEVKTARTGAPTPSADPGAGARSTVP